MKKSRGFVLTASLLLAVLAVAGAARWSFAIPGAAAPQSGQTLAVVVVAALLGPIWGPAAMATYVAVGAFGLPVFADGRAGVAVVLGPSLGFLVGFVVAAGYMGRFASIEPLRSGERLARRYVTIFVVALVAHGFVLLLGGAWLSRSLGLVGAFSGGVAPFLWGGLVKSLLGAAILTAVVAARSTSSS